MGRSFLFVQRRLIGLLLLCIVVPFSRGLAAPSSSGLIASAATASGATASGAALAAHTVGFPAGFAGFFASSAAFPRASAAASPRQAGMPPISTSIVVDAGPAWLRAVVPLPPGAGTDLALYRGDLELPTAVRPCRYSLQGEVRAVHLSALSTMGEASDEIRVGPRTLVPVGTGSEVPEFWNEVEARFECATATQSFDQALIGSDTGFTVRPTGGEFELEHGGAMFGGLSYRCWVRSDAELPVFQLWLSVHNGSAKAAIENFTQLRLSVPEGWVLVPCLDVHGREVSVKGDRTVLDLIADDSIEDHALLPQMHETHLRAVLAREEHAALANSVASGEGWGVALGPWSYSSLATPWYTSHGLRLPTLQELPWSESSVHQRVIDDWAAWEQSMSTGVPAGPGLPVRLGLGTPLGGAYGGFTGGDGIVVAPYPECFLHGGRESLQLLRARVFAATSRGTGHLYEKDGTPLRLDEWDPDMDSLFNFHISAEGPLGHTCFPGGLGNDPLGTKARSPSTSEGGITSYGAFDEQHGARFLAPVAALAALDADPLALHLLGARAQAVMASQWNGQGGEFTAPLTWLADSVESSPSEGAAVNRLEAWDLATVTDALYRRAVVNEDLTRTWMLDMLGILGECQSPIGLLGRRHSGAPAKEVSAPGTPPDQYRGAHSPWGDALLACAGGSALDGGLWDPSWGAFLDELIDGQLFAWEPSANAPLYRLAVAEDSEAEFYNSLSEVPSDGIVLNGQGEWQTDGYYLPPLLALGVMSGAYGGNLPLLKCSAAAVLRIAPDGDLMADIEKRGIWQLGMTAYLVPIAAAVPPSLWDEVLQL